MVKVSDADAAAYYNNRPKKRTNVGLLIFNRKDELLIVKPNYLDRWLLVGGAIDEGEAPRTAALRECKEEINVELDDIWLAVVDYRSPKPGESDLVRFLFGTKPVDNDFIDMLDLRSGEIDDAKFVAVEDLKQHIGDYWALEIETYHRHRGDRSTLYLEDGVQV